MGRDRPRRRQVCPASYCLSIDVAGPFEPGVDQLAGNPRYFLIGCYTLPVSQGVALTEAIGKLGGQVKMSPLDEGEEKDRLIPGEYQDYNLEENEKALAELDQVDASATSPSPSFPLLSKHSSLAPLISASMVVVLDEF